MFLTMKSCMQKLIILIIIKLTDDKKKYSNLMKSKDLRQILTMLQSRNHSNIVCHKCSTKLVQKNNKKFVDLFYLGTFYVDIFSYFL